MREIVRGRGAFPAVLVLLLATVAFLPATATAARPATTVPDGGFGPNNRPVFLMISLTPTFEFPFIDKVNGGVMNNADDLGSQVILMQVGEYVAGAGIEDTRYVGDDVSFIDLSALPDPETGLPMDPEQLDGNQLTIVGSFCTFAEEVHMVTPDPAPIAPQVQEAFFHGSATLGEAFPPGTYPTTVELACHIYENQGDAGADINDILGAMTLSAMTLDCTTCFAEDGMFPHDPSEEPLFEADVRFDTETGAFELEICLPIEIQIKGRNPNNPFNLNGGGSLPIVIPGSDSFDPIAELDLTTLEVGQFVIGPGGDPIFEGAPAVNPKFNDQNGDGKGDLLVHFDAGAIAALDGVDENTTELWLRGRTKLGMCVEGVDAIRIVPPNK